MNTDVVTKIKEETCLINQGEEKYVKIVVQNETGFVFPIREWKTYEKLIVFDIDYCLYGKKCDEDDEFIWLEEVFEKMKEERCNMWNKVGFRENLGNERSIRRLFTHGFQLTDEEIDNIETEWARKIVKRDEKLIDIFERLVKLKEKSGGKLGIFAMTNAPLPRAKYALTALDLYRFFDIVVHSDVSLSTESKKPYLTAYRFVEALAGIKAPEGDSVSRPIIFFDDNQRNIDGATVAGWTSHLVDGNIHDLIEREILNAVFQ